MRHGRVWATPAEVTQIEGLPVSVASRFSGVATLFAFAALGGMADVHAAQVREQEHQRKRERTDKHSNPCPHFEAASPALGNSTGRID